MDYRKLLNDNNAINLLIFLSVTTSSILTYNGFKTFFGPSNIIVYLVLLCYISSVMFAWRSLSRSISSATTFVKKIKFAVSITPLFILIFSTSTIFNVFYLSGRETIARESFENLSIAENRLSNSIAQQVEFLNSLDREVRRLELIANDFASKELLIDEDSPRPDGPMYFTYSRIEKELKNIKRDISSKKIYFEDEEYLGLFQRMYDFRSQTISSSLTEAKIKRSDRLQRKILGTEDTFSKEDINKIKENQALAEDIRHTLTPAMRDIRNLYLMLIVDLINDYKIEIGNQIISTSTMKGLRELCDESVISLLNESDKLPRAAYNRRVNILIPFLDDTKKSIDSLISQSEVANKRLKNSARELDDLLALDSAFYSVFLGKHSISSMIGFGFIIDFFIIYLLIISQKQNEDA